MSVDIYRRIAITVDNHSKDSISIACIGRCSTKRVGDGCMAIINDLISSRVSAVVRILFNIIYAIHVMAGSGESTTAQ